MRLVAHRRFALLAALAATGCRCGDEPEPQRHAAADPPPRNELPNATAYLDGALLDGRYDSTALAELGRDLPRPTPTGSPLVALYSGIVDELRGQPSERLRAVGVQADAPIELSLRALDGRAASVRKLLGELEADPAADPALLARLRSEAGTLGLHLRASLPYTDQAKLVAALLQIVGEPGEWAPVCEALARTKLCTGRERVLVWARPAVGERLRVDAIYLFYEGAEQAELEWIAKRADAWASADSPFAGPPARELELLLRAEPSRDLLQAEALADAVVSFAAEDLDYHGYLDREQALRDLVPSARVFDGLRVGVDVDGALDVELRWIAGAAPPVAIAELFAPLAEPFDVPALDDDCTGAPVCARMAGLTIASRFAPLALGPFADSSGASRVLRQAGERGAILLLLASWPNLLGTAGRMAAGEGERGLMAEAQAALINQAYAVGGTLLALGQTAAEDRWAGYLRVGPLAYATVRPLAGLAGIGPRPITLDGVAAQVDRGRYESTWVYFADERGLAGGHGGWLLAADADERAAWLLSRPREPAGELDELGYLRINELGRLAAREAVAFGDDPPVRGWLDDRSVELRLSMSGDGPRLRLRVEPGIKR